MGCNSSSGVSDATASRTKCGSHLTSPDDLTGWPEFPADCKSAVSRMLTKDIWKAYHNKSDKSGVSFKTCVFSGCQNVDSGIGCYAGSADSYSTFNKFFDKIVEDYHGHKPSDKHVSNMDASKLNTPPFSEEEAALVNSTRIRVGRNLADYPLGPGITNEQRDEIMERVTTACKTFEGDLAGQFYPLLGMDETTRE